MEDIFSLSISVILLFRPYFISKRNVYLPTCSHFSRLLLCMNSCTPNILQTMRVLPKGHKSEAKTWFWCKKNLKSTYKRLSETLWKMYVRNNWCVNFIIYTKINFWFHSVFRFPRKAELLEWKPVFACLCVRFCMQVQERLQVEAWLLSDKQSWEWVGLFCIFWFILASNGLDTKQKRKSKTISPLTRAHTDACIHTHTCTHGCMHTHSFPHQPESLLPWSLHPHPSRSFAEAKPWQVH